MSHLTFHLGAAEACIRLIKVSPSHDYHLLARPCQEDEKEAYRMLLTSQMFEDCMGLRQRDMLEPRVSYFSANIKLIKFIYYIICIYNKKHMFHVCSNVHVECVYIYICMYILSSFVQDTDNHYSWDSMFARCSYKRAKKMWRLQGGKV